MAKSLFENYDYVKTTAVEYRLSRDGRERKKKKEISTGRNSPFSNDNHSRQEKKNTVIRA